jgi:chromosomal replication initiation ATPase DnaA
MGCDYYICKDLEINFKYGDYTMINLERDSGYFHFSLDEDDPDYDTKYQEYIEETLKPRMKPITIYEDNAFESKKLEDKYKSLIEEELETYNKNRSIKKEWKDIIKIVKIETRYERD